MRLKLLLKRGGLLAAANWPAVAIQFGAQTTFQLLLAVPIVGAAILVAVLLGGDLTNLLQGSTRDMFTGIANALVSEPWALAAFVVAFAIVLVGGSVFMFLVKGGTVEVMLAADRAAGPIEGEPIGFDAIREARAFTVERFIAGCQRLFPRYLALGVGLMVVYALTAGAYLAFLVYGYRNVGDGVVLAWTMIAASSAVIMVFWITMVNLVYLLVQIASAAEELTIGGALSDVGRFVRAELLDLGGVFLVIFALVLAATLASGLAFSAVALISFVPLVGLIVVPLQVAALLVRGLVFEYIGLVAMGAYLALYRRYSTRRLLTSESPMRSPLPSAPQG